MRSEKEWRNYQEKIENTFLGEFQNPFQSEGSQDGPKTGNYRNLEIVFDTFIEYFQMEGSLLEKYKEDVAIDEE
jgi:hypothetical protein